MTNCYKCVWYKTCIIENLNIVSPLTTGPSPERNREWFIYIDPSVWCWWTKPIFFFLCDEHLDVVVFLYNNRSKSLWNKYQTNIISNPKKPMKRWLVINMNHEPCLKHLQTKFPNQKRIISRGYADVFPLKFLTLEPWSPRRRLAGHLHGCVHTHGVGVEDHLNAGGGGCVTTRVVGSWMASWWLLNG